MGDGYGSLRIPIPKSVWAATRTLFFYTVATYTTLSLRKKGRWLISELAQVVFKMKTISFAD